MQLYLKAEGRDGGEGEYGGQASTFGEFRRRLAQVTSLPLETLRIKVGDPPEFIDFPDSTPLADTPITKNCAVYAVRERVQDTSGPEAASGAAAAATTEHTPHTCENCTNATAAHSSRQEQRSEPEGSQLSRLPSVESSFDMADKSIPALVAFRDGYLVRRSVPSDNSCLFRSLCSVLGQVGLTSERLRELVCQGILDNPEQYNEAVLEKPIPEYCHWISQPSSWGGGIEMAILSERFSVEICSIDIQSLRVDRFGEGKYARRVILLYSGIHYDYVAFASSASAPRDFDQTEFGVVLGADDAVLAAAVELAASLRGHQSHYTALLARIKCNECGQIVHGGSEAQLHATTTGHTSFIQV
ncbi:ubiquitin-specific protease otu1 [Coemansia sp. RSA 2050]|nr:ubiquitin-specific protease otu1 [Coemansia sp. RSA 2050]KAJ2736880.1 ubiquitin-specific protease otu1 [Coemansia sp. BCRC 34962]